MQINELKPILTALILPPAGPLLLVMLGLLLAVTKRRTAGLLIGWFGGVTLWLISCNGMGILLSQTLLPRIEPISVQKLQAADTQVIVVLGAGVLHEATEYGIPQPTYQTLTRLRYGVWLARHSGKPLAFSGGVSWSADPSTMSEVRVAQRVTTEEYGMALQWTEERSGDTADNARQLWQLTQADGIKRIALVTEALHMPRAVLEFERAGFQVLPAPMSFAAPRTRSLLEWLPSSQGLSLSRQVLREWLALRVAGSE